MIEPPRARRPTTSGAAGPLKGLRVLEFAGAGPGPFCGMLLSDMGADVVRVDRPGAQPGLSVELTVDVVARGRASIVLDLKDPADRSLCLDAIARADVLIEGYRPGVMERLGLGPETAMARNGRLIYGRMTGWGQDGPLAQKAGHDINYIALSGALAAFGDPDRPPRPPLNLLGDFAGGALFLAFGIVSALFERERSGLGQVIDASIVDGAAVLMAVFAGMLAVKPDALERGVQGLAGSGPLYRCYECRDGRFLAVGAIEQKFRQAFLAGIGIDDTYRDNASLAAFIGERLRTRGRDEWCETLSEVDACVAPVLSLAEAFEHSHARARKTHAAVAGVSQPLPAPRLSRTPGAIQGPEPHIGAGGRERLAGWGVAEA